jgi:hypothetical protein
LYAKPRLTTPAPASLNKKTYERDEFKPSERPSAGEAMGTAADDARIKDKTATVVSQRNDIQKTTYYDAENKKHQRNHGFILTYKNSHTVSVKVFVS